MKIGDRVKVYYTNGSTLVGDILGESGTSWKIAPLNGNKPVSVLKTERIELWVPEVDPNPYDGDGSGKPKKRQPWGMYVALFLLAAAVVLAFIFIG